MRPPLIRTDMGQNPLFGSDRLYTTFSQRASIGFAPDAEGEGGDMHAVAEGREAGEPCRHAAGISVLGRREGDLELPDRPPVEPKEAFESRLERRRSRLRPHRRRLGPQERHHPAQGVDDVAVRARVGGRRNALEPARIGPAHRRDSCEVVLPGRLGLAAAGEAEPEAEAETNRGEAAEYESDV